MNDFVRTGDDGWFARLAVHLSASARLAFENTDPAKIPATKVIGNISAMPSANGWLAQVVISTNAGRYIVLMSPRDLDGWIVERIAPIAAAH